MSIPPTVVPDTSTIRKGLPSGFLAFMFATSTCASFKAWSIANMPINDVRLIICLDGMPSISLICSFDKSTSPTGSSWWTDWRYFISPIPVRPSCKDCKTSCLFRPIAETIPSPVIAIFILPKLYFFLFLLT